MDDSAPAVDETKMDVAMMEGGPEVMDEEMPMEAAPSVALSGSAKMGLKRVDDNASMDPESDNIKTVVEYEVSFSSSGVTDGGLVFGAAISIDEEGKGAAGSNGVNEASVHIGSAEGTWKLQFGSNDPGIDLVGNVGLADADNISGMTKTVVPLMYTDKNDNDKMKRVMLFPHADGRTLGSKGVVQFVLPAEYTATNPAFMTSFDAQGAYTSVASSNRVPLSYIKQKAGGIKYNFSRTTANPLRLDFTISGTDMPAPPPGRTAMALTGTIDSFSYALTAGEAGEDAWSAGIKYDPGTFYVSAGADSNDVLAIGAGGTFSGFTGKATYVKQDAAETFNRYVRLADVKYRTGTVGNAGTLNTGNVSTSSKVTVNEMEAYGLSVSRDIGSGSNIALTYSRLTDKTFKTFVGTKQWELDFTYDLGGGASFYAGIEQANKSEVKSYNYAVAGEPSAVVVAATPYIPVTYTPVIKKSKVTTL